MLKQQVYASLMCKMSQGTWVAQLIEHLTLELSSGFESQDYDLKPHIGLYVRSGTHLKKKSAIS